VWRNGGTSTFYAPAPSAVNADLRPAGYKGNRTSARDVCLKKGDDMANSRTTTDHEEIRRWAEERGGVPATVAATEQGGEPGILRIDFPGFSGEGTLEEISWDDFFRKFEESNLAFLFEEGSDSRFNKLVSRATAQQKESGDRSRSRSTQARGVSTNARRSSGTRSRATSAKSSRSSGRKRSSSKPSSSRTSARGRKGGSRRKATATSSRSSRSSRASGTRAGSSRSSRRRTTSARSRSASSGRTKRSTTARAKTTARASSGKRKVQSSRSGRPSRRAA
jgi:hypothetical protein